MIGAFLARTGKHADEPTDDLRLFSEGLELDSLDAAEMSAALEDELGCDPFSTGALPQTVGEVLSFYDGSAA